MAKKRRLARDVASWRDGKDCWLDHAEIVERDYEWLAPVEKLTLWNVRVPASFLARLDSLWWLDIRGGSAANLEVAKGASKLQYLAVNQVRGMQDLSIVCEIKSLRYLDLYGLLHVTRLPSLSALAKLERASVGQMRGLASLAGLLEAPNLRDLELVRKVNLSSDDLDVIVNHPTIERFNWWAEDIPDKVWVPVVEQIGLPPVPIGFPADWFAARGRR
jgi:hypothetical protein